MNTPECSANLITLALLAKFHIITGGYTYTLTGLKVHLYITESTGQL